MKLIIVDLDGTLFDTKDVNYYAYKEAIDVEAYREYLMMEKVLDFLRDNTGVAAE